MIHKKLFMAFALAGALCLGQPAGAQNGAPPKTIDRDALAAALQNCPGLNGKLDADTLAKAAQNCPGLNGTAKGANCPDLTSGKIDPVALAAAIQNCPALNQGLPEAARNCPALNGDLAAAAKNCPAFAGGFSGPGAQQGNIDRRIDRRMKRIVRALERNKQSAETLIQAARRAGADPKSVSELEQMSEAFRQVFMNLVSPQQIIESILSRQAQQPSQETGQGLIITGPDGSVWLVSPSEQNPQPQPPQGIIPPQGMAPQGPPPGFVPPQGMSPQGPPPGFVPPQGVAPQTPPPGFVPPQGMSPQGPPPGWVPPQAIPPQQGFVAPPQGMPPVFGKQTPPQFVPGKPSAIGKPPRPAPQAPAAPQQPQQVQPQGELIIMEQVTPQYMPLWPTKDDLGKDGVLRYLEKRDQMANTNS